MLVPEYEFHPACLLMPDMEPDAFTMLRKSIAAGFNKIHPIILHEGKILDGRHRYLACADEGVKPVFAQFSGNDPYNYVWTEHAARRSWASQQQKVLVYRLVETHSAALQEKRAAIKAEADAARSAAMQGVPHAKKGEQRKNDVGVIPQAPSNKKSEAKARKAEAAMLGVCESAIRDADIIAKNSALAEKVISGEVAASKAKSEIKTAARTEAMIKQSKEDTEQTPPVIVAMDAIEWLKIQEPADLLLTDPPYMTDVEDINAFAASWLPLALSKVKPTGRAFVCIGAYPEEIAAYLAVAMPKQILVWTYRNTIGPKPKTGYKLNWQAILYYEMPGAPDIDCPLMVEQFTVQDINAPDGRQGDRFHAWQKPAELAERFVRHSTKPGDTVIDPFCCTGTFLLAAAKYGRIGRGCDNNAENLKIAETRGCSHAA